MSATIYPASSMRTYEWIRFGIAGLIFITLFISFHSVLDPLSRDFAYRIPGLIMTINEEKLFSLVVSIKLGILPVFVHMLLMSWGGSSAQEQKGIAALYLIAFFILAVKVILDINLNVASTPQGLGLLTIWTTLGAYLAGMLAIATIAQSWYTERSGR